jgi:hypothetical protein
MNKHSPAYTLASLPIQMAERRIGDLPSNYKHQSTHPQSLPYNILTKP